MNAKEVKNYFNSNSHVQLRNHKKDNLSENYSTKSTFLNNLSSGQKPDSHQYHHFSIASKNEPPFIR